MQEDHSETVPTESVFARQSNPAVFVRRTAPTPRNAFSTFWKFAAERQQVYLKRVAGEQPPWTEDTILRTFKFTNVYRAADRVSQFLINDVQPACGEDPETLFLSTILFKLFNRIETWKALIHSDGPPDPSAFTPHVYAEILEGIRAKRMPIYSGAYIMPSGGQSRPKHLMHLQLLVSMLRDRLPFKVAESGSLRDSYNLLRSYPSLGPFLAYQYAIDLNYSTITCHSEMEYIVPGPGAIDGISKCFESLGDYSPADAIRWTTESQRTNFERQGLEFPGLWGRPLQLIDVQNLFCEVSKYTRESHPDLPGTSRRTRIKQRFKPTGPLPLPRFPADWNINHAVMAQNRPSSAAPD